MSATDANATVQSVKVSLGSRSYSVLVGDGLLDTAGARVAPLLARPWTVVVTDENVATSQGGRVLESLAAAGVAAETIALSPGEGSKSFAGLEKLLDALLAKGVERSDMILALGGGVVGDIAGFAAAILRRGCRFAQLPTSLLAQVDSSVGGKTAVNAAAGKNLIGAFHQPSVVIADVAALDTLPERERRAGYAEIVKYGAIDDPAFFGWLEENGDGVMSGARAAQIEAVTRSVAAKARIVAEDETERGRRALLNLGHTFGHALEAAFDYSDALLHGEAVAAGMSLAFDYSVEEGLCRPTTPPASRLIFGRRGFPQGSATWKAPDCTPLNDS